jgi:plastocyanin
VLQEIWNNILEFLSKLILPDWGAIISFLPVAILGLVVLVFVLLLAGYARLGPRRRGGGPRPPLPPAGVHEGPRSYAPIFAGVGVGLALWGLVIGGWALFLGIAALVLTLIYWLREGLRDYEHLPDAERPPPLPAVAHDGPPPGVHMIGPSFLPLLGALGVSALLFGLVFGPWLIGAGVIILIVTLLAWLRDGRREYDLAVKADRTGHLDVLPPPRWPKALLTFCAVVFVAGIALNAGLLGGGEAAGGEVPSGRPGASGAPPPPPGGSGAPAPSGGTGGGPSLPAADAVVVAEGTQFTTPDVKAPADEPFTIAFDNRDTGQPHDVDIVGPDGNKVFDGEIVTGPKVVTYNVPALAPGTYPFHCSVHANMTGTLTAGG